MPRSRSVLSWFLSAVVTMIPTLNACSESALQQPAQTSTSGNGSGQAPAATYAKPSPDELYQLVAPIALFPDNLVAQVLAASTYPDQVSSANTWLKQNANLKGNDLMQAADKQQWDVSVRPSPNFPMY